VSYAVEFARALKLAPIYRANVGASQKAAILILYTIFLGVLTPVLTRGHDYQVVKGII